MKHVVIIGNGISGITCARFIRKKSNFQITVISAETPHFFSRTALMYVFMGHMKFEHTKPYEDHFWKKNRINLVQAFVNEVDTENKILNLENGNTVAYDKLVIATGSKSNKFGWPGQDLPGVQGLYSYQDLQLLEENSSKIRKAVIVGGGLIGVELAEMLLSRNIKVTFLVREKQFWNNVLPAQESALISDHIMEHHVDLRCETELKEIKAGSDGWVKSVLTSTGEEIDCQMVGLTAGVSPNVDFLRNSNIQLNRGILVNEFMETNVPDVYAIGDCVENTNPVEGRRSIEQVWYTGRMMGEVLAETITGSKTAYSPGPWFNSAKFFDIEYQTYGVVPPEIEEGQDEFYWENKEKKLAIHVIWEKSDFRFSGINSFGIRLKHDTFDLWLRSHASVHDVMKNLKSACFDPEFYVSWFDEIWGEFEKRSIFRNQN